jgi:8-oxo-dGTP pyrophosphatase MutT (NUDIX family)
LWGGVAGYIEELEDPYNTAVKEIQEEAGISLDALELIWKGDPIELSDTYGGKRYDWIVYPFLFRIRSKELVRLDWEHDEYRWVSFSEVKKFDTVPGLDEVVTKILSAGGII